MLSHRVHVYGRTKCRLYLFAGSVLFWLSEVLMFFVGQFVWCILFVSILAISIKLMLIISVVALLLVVMV